MHTFCQSLYCCQTSCFWKQLICGGGSLVLVTEEGKGALWGSDLLQAKCQWCHPDQGTADSFEIWDSSLLPLGLLDLFFSPLTQGCPKYHVFEETILNFSLKFGKPLSFFWLIECIPLPRENFLPRLLCEGAKRLSSQKNDETKERETGSTMPTNSVRRLGSLSKSGTILGIELMPTNAPSFA